jgi:hypothetical protein
MFYAYIYAALGLLVAIWFYLKMRRWADIGNTMTRSRSGSVKMLLLLPFAAILWPITAWILWQDTRP